MFSKFNEKPLKNLKIRDAYLKERNVTEKMSIPLKSGIKADDFKGPGFRKKPAKYAYAELASIVFSVSSKFKNIRSVNLIHSSSDMNEEVDDLASLIKNLSFDKLHKGSTNKDIVFNSNCQLVYCSTSNVRIKNFLVNVDTKKYGSDIFVIQTLQSPIIEYHEEFDIDGKGSLTSFKIVAQFVNRKFRMKRRIVMINELDKMMEPFILGDTTIQPGLETKAFKNFVEAFNSASKLGLLN
ncbi:hypothetical protein SaSA374_0199 [Streptococcus agalactiae]|nr:hypothetical protein SaSA374_0199 [Streptococcus agalactiae]